MKQPQQAMLTLFTLLKTYELKPEQVRIVRHGNKHMNILETFRKETEKLTEYTSWQKPGRFGSAEYLVAFCPSRGTTSLFLGVWKILGVTENKNLAQQHKESFSMVGFPEHVLKSDVRYDLELTSIMGELSQRLVIEWGDATVSWCQSKDKDIVQIKPSNSIEEFVSYGGTRLSYENLVRLIKNKDSNASWVNALSTVNGVYLIKYKKDGRLYVGSAYGKGGILGRWEAYARTGHANNGRLKILDPREFEFTILEISSSTMSWEEVIARENRWKECLSTREFGLNEN